MSNIVYVDGIGQFGRRFFKLEGVGEVHSVARGCPIWSGF